MSCCGCFTSAAAVGTASKSETFALGEHCTGWCAALVRHPHRGFAFRPVPSFVLCSEQNSQRARTRNRTISRKVIICIYCETGFRSVVSSVNLRVQLLLLLDADCLCPSAVYTVLWLVTLLVHDRPRHMSRQNIQVYVERRKQQPVKE